MSKKVPFTLARLHPVAYPATVYRAHPKISAPRSRTYPHPDVGWGGCKATPRRVGCPVEPNVPDLVRSAASALHRQTPPPRHGAAIHSPLRDTAVAGPSLQVHAKLLHELDTVTAPGLREFSYTTIRDTKSAG